MDAAVRALFIGALGMFATVEALSYERVIGKEDQDDAPKQLLETDAQLAPDRPIANFGQNEKPTVGAACIIGCSLSLLGNSAWEKSSCYSAWCPNLWNTSSATAKAIYQPPGGLTTTVSFSKLTLSDARKGVAGYPNISYGESPWQGSKAQNNSLSGFKLPLQMSDFALHQPVWLSAKYTISNPQLIPINFAYDLWITKNRPVTGNPQQGPANPALGGGLELMIWIYANSIHPAGNRVGSLLIATSIDDQQRRMQWDLYRGGGGSGTPVITVALHNPISSGSVEVALNSILSKIGTYEPAAGNYFIDQIDLGSEFGLVEGQLHPYSYHWTVNYFAIGSCMDGGRGARANLTFFAKRSGAVMYAACFRLEACLCDDAAAMAAGRDVIR